MVTLILLFIFVTPHLWDYGAKPPSAAGPLHPFQVVGAGHGVIITVQAADVKIPAGASYERRKNAAQGHRAGHGRCRFRGALGYRNRRPGKSGLEGLGAPVIRAYIRESSQSIPNQIPEGV